jgi:hypothetical protein
LSYSYVNESRGQVRWESSTAASWIAPSQRTDAWGHAFCVQSDQQETIVVSPGPQALSSLDCNNLKVTGKELAQMPQGRLNPHASGALILFVKRSDTGPIADSIVDPKNGNLHVQVPALVATRRKP